MHSTVIIVQGIVSKLQIGTAHKMPNIYVASTFCMLSFYSYNCLSHPSYMIQDHNYFTTIFGVASNYVMRLKLHNLKDKIKPI